MEVNHWWMLVWMTNSFLAGILADKKNKDVNVKTLLGLNALAAILGAFEMFVFGVSH